MEAEAEAEGGGWGCVEEGLESGNGKEGRNGWAGLDSLAWLQREARNESFPLFLTPFSSYLRF